MSVSARRVQLEPAFLLHHYPWRDSSRIVELLTRGHGRVSVFARASRAVRLGAVGSALQPFAELLVSWSGRGEAGQLTGAERVRPPAQLAGDRLMSGFYANELLLKLLDAARPASRAVRCLRRRCSRSSSSRGPTRSGRCGCSRSGCSTNSAGASTSSRTRRTGAPVDAARAYRYRIDGGPELLDGVAEGSLIFSGASLLSLAREALDDRSAVSPTRAGCCAPRWTSASTAGRCAPARC